MKRFIVVLLVIVPSFLLGCGQPPMPKPQQYQDWNAVTITPRGTLSIEDYDGDGKADALATSQTSRMAFWIADKTVENRVNTYGNAMIMTPEIREKATQIRKLEQELCYLLAKQEYDAYKADEAKAETEK